MEINNVFSPVPFYASKRYWHSNKWYTYGQKCPIIMTAEKTLPFQLVVSPGVTLSSFTIKKADNDTSVMTVNTAGNYFSIDAEAYSIIQVKACAIGTLPYGNYYYALTLSDGSTYISDIIAVISDMSKCIKITYKNVENLYFSSGHIDFTNDFVFELYLPTTIGKPEYEYEEELTKRLGYKFVESQVVNKVYKFTFPATEQLCDAYRFVRMCDYIRIDTYNSDFSDYGHYNVIYLSSEVEWLDNGDIASVETSFETDSIVQKLQDYSRTQLVNFYNALLSNSDEALKFDDETIAQYYNNYLQSIDGKMIRQLNAVSSISDNTVIAIDENNGTGAANKILLRPLLINTVAEQLRASEVLANFQQHINNSAIHITVAEKAILSLFGVDDNGDVYVKGDKGFYTNSFISAKGKSSSAGGGGGVSALYQLVDVLANSTNDGVLNATNGSVLMYNGTKWYAGAIDAGLDEAALKAYLDANKYTTTIYVDSKLDTKADKTALNAYATLTYVNDELAGTNSTVSTLTEKVNNFLEGTDTDGIINKWKELEAFLAGQTQTSTLADLLNVKAFASTKIIAGTGLTGGGDLTADRTLSLATSGVTAGTYPKVTVDKYGRATAGSSLSASDIPNLSWNKITSDKPTTLSGYGITDGVNSVTVSGSGNAVTAASVSGHVLTLTKGVTFLPQSTFDDLFEKVLLEDGKTYAIRAKYGFYSDSFVSSKGLNSSLSGGGSASALYQLVDVLANSTNDGVLNATNGSVLMYNGTKWYAGNVVTDISPLTLNVNGSNLFTYNGKSSITANLTVPTKVSQLTNDTGFITGISSSMVTNALGYTPYNSTNPNGYISSITKAMVEGVLTGNITSHTHSYLPLSGGTLTGQLTISSGNDAKLILDNTDTEVKYQYISFRQNGTRYGYLGTTGSDSLVWSDNVILTERNYGICVPSKTGEGASGTWGINITGNAATATNADTIDEQHLMTQVSDWNTDSLSIFKSSESSISNAPVTDYTYGVTLRFHRDTSIYHTDLVTSLYYDRLFFRRKAGGEYQTWRELIHSGNIGSQSVNYANSAGNADTLDGYHADIMVKSYADSTDNFTSFTNRAFFQTSFIPDQGDFCSLVIPTWKDNRTDTYYTTELRFGLSSYNPRIRFTRPAGTSDWYTLATTADNVASATKLQTARTLWGQSFDGTGNVSGALSGVTDITANGQVTFSYRMFIGGGLQIGYWDAVNNRLENFNRPLLITSYEQPIGIGFSGDNSSVYISTTGNVGIGTTTPAYKLDVNGIIRSSNVIFGYMYGANSNAAAFMWDKPGSYYTGVGSNGTANTIRFSACNADGTWASYTQNWQFYGNAYATGAVTAKASSSDIRLKTDITDYKALSIIRGHKSIKYHWNEVAKANADIFNDDYWHYGLIAQDVQRDMPQMVSDVFKDYLVINYERLIPICWKGLQEVDDEVTRLKKRIEYIENKLNDNKQ